MLLVVAYTGYLVYAGLTLMLLPWHDAWGVILSRLPPEAAIRLDLPWLRGLISGFGALHLIVLAAEMSLPDGVRGYLDGAPARLRSAHADPPPRSRIRDGQIHPEDEARS